MKRLFFILLLFSFTFAACEDECSDIECLNGGTCEDGSCQCADGYEGETCELLSREKFIGNYSVSEQCNSNNFDYMSTITTGDGHRKVNFTNFYDLTGFYGISQQVYGLVHENAISIPSQNVSGGPMNANFTVSGNGTYSGGLISLSYTVYNNANGTSRQCSATYSKE